MGIALIILAALVGWWVYNTYLNPRRFSRYTPWYEKYSGMLVVVGAIGVLLVLVLTPNQRSTQSLTQVFKDNPQNTEIHFNLGAVNLAFINELRASPEYQTLVDRISKIQLEGPAVDIGGDNQSAPQDAPAAPEAPVSQGDFAPADCGREVKTPRDGFKAYSCGKILVVVPPEMWEGHHAELVAETVKAYEFDSRKSGLVLKDVLRTSYDYDDTCGTGFTEAKIRVVHAYVCSSESIAHATLIMAHEIGHQLEEDNFPHDDDADLWIQEGFASWVSSDYWFGHQSPKQFVKANYPGEQFRIQDGSNGDDHSYNHWAAVVDFIYQTKGRDALFQLYDSGRPGQAIKYEEVLHMSLDELNQAYFQWLQQP